jgi:hypothetical protein
VAAVSKNEEGMAWQLLIPLNRKLVAFNTLKSTKFRLIGTKNVLD